MYITQNSVNLDLDFVYHVIFDTIYQFFKHYSNIKVDFVMSLTNISGGVHIVYSYSAHFIAKSQAL